MSAIFGLFQRDGQPMSPSDPAEMERALAHHVQDGGGRWVASAVGLGVRLRFFTPEDSRERQPLVSEDGRWVLVADARLDNRRELLAAVRRPPTITDGELILRACEQWGEAAIEHLVGFYALALWDAQNRRLLLARSPIVAPALYWFSTPQAFAFATAPSALFASGMLTRRINEEKLADMLVQSPANPDATLYRDIYRLSTGHTLSLDSDGIRTRRFWPTDATREIRFARDDEYVDAFNDLLERVVADSLRSLTPVGLMLSGGLDSASLAAVAAGQLMAKGERLTAYTETPRPGFDGPVVAGRYADETPFVQAIAGMHANLDLQLIRTQGRTFLDGLELLFFHLETPFRNTTNRLWIQTIFEQARSQGIHVLLDGSQGNLTSSWRGSGLLPQLLRTGRWGRALRVALAGGSPWRSLTGQGILPLLPKPLWLAVEWARGRAELRGSPTWRLWSPIHPDFAAEQRVDARAKAVGHDFHNRASWESRTIRSEALANQDFGYYTSAWRSMFGVDSRSPLADVRLAEFCLALPEEQFLYRGEDRSLARRAMAGRLPAAVLTNRRRGMQAADWYEGMTEARGQMLDEVERLQSCELARRALDLERMRRLITDWPQSGWNEMSAIHQYYNLLGRGLVVGRFLCWFAEGATGATP